MYLDLTPWFHNTTKPVREGVYQTSIIDPNTEYGPLFLYSYWNGKEWLRRRTTAYAAGTEKEVLAVQQLHWRGIFNVKIN